MTLQPDLVELRVPPVGEQANAVRARGQLVIVLFQLCEWKVFIHILLHLEGWGNIEGEFGDHTQPAKPDDGSLELLTVLLSRENHEVTVTCHQFHSRDSRSK